MTVITELLKCGFVEITEKDIPSYIGEDDDLASFEEENVSEFGYLSIENYCIIKLDRQRNDAVLRYKNGSSIFIIRYDNKLYAGYWDEGESIIGKDDNWGSNSRVFSHFKRRMLAENIMNYYCDNF